MKIVRKIIVIERIKTEKELLMEVYLFLY